jgi:DNA-binding FadR family transcriptional regulator
VYDSECFTLDVAQNRVLEGEIRKMGQIVRFSLTEAVRDKVLNLISDGLSVGDPIPSSAQLARRFDVSIVVVREALAQLVGQGIVSSRQGREAIVAMPGPEILAQTLAIQAHHLQITSEEFLGCRAALECEAASLAARQPKSMRVTLLKPLKGLQDAQVLDDFTKADVAIHLAIARLSGNSALELILQALHDVIQQEMFYRTQVEKDTDFNHRFEVHERIVSAIIQGDSGLAREAMAEHFKAARLTVANNVTFQPITEKKTSNRKG